MSHRKGALPETYVLGSRPILIDEEIETPTGEKIKTGGKVQKIDVLPPLFTAAGRPVGRSALRLSPAWEMPQPMGVVSHWINEAARRRCHGDMALAEKKELVQVPIFKGVSMRFANEQRYHARKAEIKRSIMAQVKAAIESRRQAMASRSVRRGESKRLGQMLASMKQGGSLIHA
jgi:hypothetical protein